MALFLIARSYQHQHSTCTPLSKLVNTKEKRELWCETNNWNDQQIKEITLIKEFRREESIEQTITVTNRPQK